MWRSKRPHGGFSLPGVKRASRAAAGLLLNHDGINRALELHDTFDYRARCSLGHDARNGESGEDFVGVTSIEVTLVVSEGEFAAPHRDIDIAYLADDGIDRDGYLIYPLDQEPLALEQA